MAFGIIAAEYEMTSYIFRVSEIEGGGKQMEST